MFAQTLAFLTRSIRQESRLLSHHAVRGAMVLLTLVAFFSQVVVSPRLGASGLMLVTKISDYCYYSLTLLGIMYFSLAITEEKEEETLPLLRMTGVRNFTLLIGKSIPRLAIVVLLMMVAAPFLLLSVTLGGVLPDQIFALILGMMCYAFCLSQLGLFCSTISRNSRRAVSTNILMWMALEFGSWFVILAAAVCKAWEFFALQHFLNALAESWWHCTMWSATEQYLVFLRGDSILSMQMAFHLCTGSVFFVASWLMFESMNVASIAEGAAASENISRDLKTRATGVRSLRCWNTAVAWKSWQFLVGGWLWVAIGVIGLPVLSVGGIVLLFVINQENIEPEAIGVTLMVVGAISFVIMSARQVGRALNQEIYQQTLVSLCMLPKRRSAVIGELYLGLVPGVLGPVCCFGLGFLWLSIAEPGFMSDTAEVLIEPWTWAVLGWVIMTLHVGALLAVYLRHGGMLIAVAICCFAVPFAGGIVIGMLGMILSGIGPGMEESIMRYLFPMTLIFAEAAVCVAMYALIYQRVEALAGK
jgi:hypothetical protein